MSKLDDELTGDQWFDAAQYLTATFTSTRVTPTARRFRH
ncbi:YceI family protein [Sphingobium yanoikuyae]